MKEFAVTDLGLQLDGHMIMPGSRLLLQGNPPNSWKRMGRLTGAEPGGAKLTPATPSAGNELEQVRAEYEAATGKKAHHKAKVETLRAEIAEAQG